MKKRSVLILFIGVCIFITGVTFGKSVFAGPNVSGTEYDPLVTKSYVEQEFASKNKILEEKIEKLKREITELENTVDKLTR